MVGFSLGFHINAGSGRPKHNGDVWGPDGLQPSVELKKLVRIMVASQLIEAQEMEEA